MNQDTWNDEVNCIFREFLQNIEKCEPGSAKWEFCWAILTAIKDYKEQIQNE